MSKRENRNEVILRKELQRFIIGYAAKHYESPSGKPNISGTISGIIEEKYKNMPIKERDAYVALGKRYEDNEKELSQD